MPLGVFDRCEFLFVALLKVGDNSRFRDQHFPVREFREGDWEVPFVAWLIVPEGVVIAHDVPVALLVISLIARCFVAVDSVRFSKPVPGDRVLVWPVPGDQLTGQIGFPWLEFED